MVWLFSFIAEADKLVLEQDFGKDEIVKALMEMRGDKAPRINGYYYGISKTQLRFRCIIEA